MPFPEETEFILPDGIVLNAAPVGGVFFSCATFDGWGSPGSKSSGTSREGEHGDSPAPNPKLGARILQMSGRIAAPTRLARQQAEHRLEAALSLALFDLTVTDGIPLKVQAQRQGEVSRADDTDVASLWQAELKCPDPRRYGIADRQQSLTLPVLSGGVRFPLRFPLRFDGSTTFGDADVINLGNMPAPAKVTFTGPLTTPSITNVTTGQSVTYNDTLAVGETLVLYLRYPMLALLQGTANRTGKVSTGGGGIWAINPGTNSLAFRSVAGSGTALVEWSDTYQ